jgi:hypothetical protein
MDCSHPARPNWLLLGLPVPERGSWRSGKLQRVACLAARSGIRARLYCLTHKYEVTSGLFHQLSWRPSMYCTGIAASSSGDTSSSAAMLTLQ